MKFFWVCVAITATVGPGSAAAAQSSPSPQARTIWDSVYTVQQAERGQQVYHRACSQCHRPNLKGGSKAAAPPLAGHAFLRRWDGASITELFALMAQTMARDAREFGGSRPHDVKLEEFLDIAAYILQKNKAPAGESELPSDARLDAITITAKAPKR